MAVDAVEAALRRHVHMGGVLSGSIVYCLFLFFRSFVQDIRGGVLEKFYDP